jgi:hypothetical protein
MLRFGARNLRMAELQGPLSVRDFGGGEAGVGQAATLR